MKPWLELRRGAVLKLRQMPWPNHPGTILPGSPPELIPGGCFVVTASFTSIRLRVENRFLVLLPDDGKLSERWVVG